MKIKAPRSGFMLVLSCFLLAGCSPGMFFAGKDQGVLKTPNYRRINKACAGINLASSTLDVPKFREILGCFNSNGAIEPIEKLVNGMSDAELQPLVSGANKHLLNNKKKLYQIDQTYKSLESKGIADNLFLQIGKILENDELIASAIAIFRTGYFGPSGQDLLQTLEIVSGDLTQGDINFAVDLGSSLTSEKSFGSLSENFSKVMPNSTRSPVLKVLISQLFKYLQEDHTYLCGDQKVPVSREFFQSILGGGKGSAGDLFSAWDEIIGLDEAMVRNNIVPLAEVFRSTLSSNGGETPLLMEKLSFALRDLQVPVQCMNSVKSIPNASLHLIRELAELPESADADIAAKYILRDMPLNFMALGPFCNYPGALKDHYSTMVEFAKTGAVGPLARTLKALSRVTRPWKGCDASQSPSGESYNALVSWMVNFLSDTGDKTAPTIRSGINYLIPSLTEMTSRDAWVDLLLVGALPTSGHQQRVKESIHYILKPRAELQQRSIYDILMKVIPASDIEEIYRLAMGIQKFMREPEPVLGPSLQSLRRALYVNDTHPFIDLIRESLSEATHEKEFYDAVFRVSTQPEFKDSIQLLSTMSKDGRLQELIGASISLFHRFAEEGNKGAVIHETELPEPLPLRHHLVRRDLTASPFHPITQATSWYSSDCDALDTTFSMDQTNAPNFDIQLNHFIKCQNEGGNDNDVTEALQFLNRETTEEGQSFLKYQIDQARKLILSPDDPKNKLNPTEINYLMDGWLSSMDDGRFFHFLDAVPFWIAPKGSQGDENSGVGLVMKPLLDVSRAVIAHSRGDLEELENYASKIVAHDDFPKLLGDLDALLTPDLSVKAESLVNPLPIALSSFDRDQIRQWIDAKECGALSNEPGIRSRQIENRVDEILREAQTNITNWDLIHVDKNSEGNPRQSWQLNELAELLNPIFDKLSEGEKQNVPQKKVLSSFLNFAHYFSMPPDGEYHTEEEKTQFHYQPQYLLEWLYDRSVDYRLITYYYPGENAPRVRLVNSLDLLELTLINVDFDAPFPVSKNMGLDFLSELADAWGDEAREMWPPEIQKQYPDQKHRPRTLLAAAEDILDRPGFPGLDNLKKLTYKFIGLPILPACHKDIPGLTPDPQAKPSMAWVNPLIMKAQEKEALQRRLYNLWQVNSILRETALNQGLKVLRDLFYEVKYSTPNKYRTPKAGAANNLSLILKSVRLGMLRQVGRIIQKFEKTDPALQDFFQTVIHSADSPYLLPAIRAALLSDPDHKLVWKVIQQIFDIIDTGTALDVANMKQIFFYFMASSNQLEKWVPSHGEKGQADLLDNLLWRSYESLKDYQLFLVKPEVNFLGDIFTSQTLSSFVRVAYEDGNVGRKVRLQKELNDFLKDSSGKSGNSRVHNGMEILKAVYENDQSRESLKIFRKRLDSVLASEGYKKLDLDATLRPILHFFEGLEKDGKTPAKSEDTVLAGKLRKSFSFILKDHSFEQLLILEQNNPERFYQLLETLSRLSADDRNKGLRNFFIMVRRSLSEMPY